MPKLKAKLYLIGVCVMYSHPDYSKEDSIERFIPVRIVALDSSKAQFGAMAYAETIIPEDLKRLGDKLQIFSKSAVTWDVIGTIDCIGESVKGG